MPRPTPEQEQHDLRLMEATFRDKALIELHISYAQAWFIVSAVQLVMRHPKVHDPMRRLIEQTGREFQRAIVESHPEVAAILEAGWDPDRDV